MDFTNRILDILGLQKRAVGIPPEWQEVVLGRKLGGAIVDSDAVSALQCSALIACIRILSTSLSSIDLGVYRKVPGGMEPAESHPLHSVVNLAVNDDLSSTEWRRDMITRLILFGRSYDQIVMNVKEEVIGLIPIHPTRVKSSGFGKNKVYTVKDASGAESTLPASEVLYIPYLFEGESLFEHARRAVNLSVSAEQFAQRFFTSGGVQQLKLETDQTVGPDKKKEIVTSLHQALKDGRVPFTDAGTKLQTLNVKFEEVQLKETRLHQLRDIARVIGIQPHLIGDLEKSTNNNIEHQGIEYVNFTCRPLARAIEQRLDMSLFGPRERLNFCARLDLTPLYQADYESTADGVSRLVTAGVMTSNEGRRRVNLNPHQDGDRLMIQGAMVPITNAGEKQTGGQDATRAV